MSRRSPSFTAADVTRACKGAAAAGIAVERIEIEGGKIIIVTAGSGKPQSANSFDRLFHEAS